LEWAIKFFMSQMKCDTGGKMPTIPLTEMCFGWHNECAKCGLNSEVPQSLLSTISQKIYNQAGLLIWACEGVNQLQPAWTKNGTCKFCYEVCCLGLSVWLLTCFLACPGPCCSDWTMVKDPNCAIKSTGTLISHTHVHTHTTTTTPLPKMSQTQ
jgi:hypothetical protein